MVVWRRIIFTGCLLYLLFEVGLVLFQRTFMYGPTSLDARTPQDFGVPYREVSLITPDGPILNAWRLEHPDSDVLRPALIYCHGNAANLSQLAEISSIFYNFGWSVLLFDYRSYGKSTGEERDLSEEAIAIDAQTAYDWLRVAEGGEERLVIWGHSLGSSIAARLAVNNHPAAVVLEGAFPSMLKVARYKYPFALIFPFMVFDKYESVSYLKAKKFPLLMIHGEDDQIIPIEMGRELYGSLTQPKQWIAIPNIGHANFPSVANRYQSEIVTFVNQSMKEIPNEPLSGR